MKKDLLEMKEIQNIDQLLSYYSKTLQPGQSISIPLYKGNTTKSLDPIKQQQQQQQQRGSNTIHLEKNALFPRMAKFMETTTKPEFSKLPWKDARFYEEDVPKIQDESDEDDDDGGGGSSTLTTATTAKHESGTADSTGNTTITTSNTTTNTASQKSKKRRWKRSSHEPPKRHWVIQEWSEFREKLNIKQCKKTDPNRAATLEKAFLSRLSQRYLGTLEDKAANHYAFMALTHPTSPIEGTSERESSFPSITVTTLHGFHNFTQPYKFTTLSMQEAELAISNQRAKMTRYMMHGKISAKIKKQDQDVNDNRSILTASDVMGGMLLGPKPKGGLVKARLMNRLMNSSSQTKNLDTAVGGGDDDDDDVMADVAFRMTKSVGRTLKARKELLSTFGGDGELAVDDDGIIGGANDAEFGGKRQRFGRFMNSDDNRSNLLTADEDGDDNMKAGIREDTLVSGDDDRPRGTLSSEGLAMDDDFYQRDVAKEYDDLDYDANELFDDDDVDIGAEEIEDSGGFAADIEDDDASEEMEEDEDELATAMLGGVGFATTSGMKMMLAKARGENIGDEGGAQNDVIIDATKLPVTSADITSGSDRSDDEQGSPPMKKARLAISDDEAKANVSVDKLKKPVAATVQVDENGDRVLTLDGVRKEIWLHSGRILLMQLAKIYNINKKTSAERRSNFVAVTKELCHGIDTVDGKMLVLKQHYSKMG